LPSLFLLVHQVVFCGAIDQFVESIAGGRLVARRTRWTDRRGRRNADDMRQLRIERSAQLRQTRALPRDRDIRGRKRGDDADSLRRLANRGEIKSEAIGNDLIEIASHEDLAARIRDWTTRPDRLLGILHQFANELDCHESAQIDTHVFKRRQRESRHV
jgi:hypothetical protein